MSCLNIYLNKNYYLQIKCIIYKFRFQLIKSKDKYMSEDARIFWSKLNKNIWHLGH